VVLLDTAAAALAAGCGCGDVVRVVAGVGGGAREPGTLRRPTDNRYPFAGCSSSPLYSASEIDVCRYLRRRSNQVELAIWKTDSYNQRVHNSSGVHLGGFYLEAN